MSNQQADRLTSYITDDIFDGFFGRTSIVIGSSKYEVVGDDELPDMDDTELVLRGEDGALYDVEIEVTVTDRDGARSVETVNLPEIPGQTAIDVPGATA